MLSFRINQTQICHQDKKNHIDNASSPSHSRRFPLVQSYGLYLPHANKCEEFNLTIDYAEAQQQQLLIGFCITHRHSVHLGQFVGKYGHRNLNQLSVYKFGSEMLDMLETLHESGYVHNDLCLKSVVIGEDKMSRQNIKLLKTDEGYNIFETDKRYKHHSLNMFNGIKLHMNEFSAVGPYIDFGTKAHLEKVKVAKVVNPNNMFSTLNKMRFIS